MPDKARDTDRRRHLADRLHSLAIHLLRRVARTDTAGGLTGPRLSALSVLVLGGGPRTLSELAAAEHVRAPTMTRLVQAMEAEGLVRRVSSASDRRSVWIRATKKGERALRQARERRLAALESLLAALGDSEVAVVERAVELLEPLA